VAMHQRPNFAAPPQQGSEQGGRTGSVMTKSRVWILVCFSILGFGPANCVAQENESEIHVTVDMVQLNVAVTDRKGNYVTGLRPEDFIITEDGIQQEIATFGEGDEATRRLAESDPAGDKPAGSPADSARPESIGDPQALASLVAGSNVFVLFDTSNYMYRGFVFAQDAIADFIRSLQSADKVAFYSYSRDLSRSAIFHTAAVMLYNNSSNSMNNATTPSSDTDAPSDIE